MPWRLILFIISLVLITFFIGFNLENACNVNFGFKQFNDVPIFLTVMFSFVAGIVVTLPFTFGRRRRNVEKPATATKPLKKTKNLEKPKSTEAPKELNPVSSTEEVNNFKSFLDSKKKGVKSFFESEKKDSSSGETSTQKPTSTDSSASSPTDQAKN